MMPSLSLKPSADLNDALVDVHDAIDRIVAMRAQETTYIAPDYLRGQCSYSDESPAMCIDDNLQQKVQNNSMDIMEVDAQCRVKMCEWCYQVVDYFKFQRETVQISMSYLDRYLATREGQIYLGDRAIYQLAAITCLYVAIKVHEPMELDMSLLAELSRGSYGVPEIMEMEDSILGALGWKMNPPTAMAFAQHMLSLLPPSLSMDAKQALMDVARYQTELSLFDYTASVLMKPSVVATAAVLNALEGVASISTSTRTHFVRNLGKMTGCTRYMEGVSDCRKLMMLYLQGNPLAPGAVPGCDYSNADEAEIQDFVRQKSSSKINMTDSSPVAIAASHQ
jgi:hypothetical protein